jgi:hypothetical protein
MSLFSHLKGYGRELTKAALPDHAILIGPLSVVPSETGQGRTVVVPIAVHIELGIVIGKAPLVDAAYPGQGPWARASLRKELGGLGFDTEVFSQTELVSRAKTCLVAQRMLALLGDPLPILPATSDAAAVH